MIRILQEKDTEQLSGHLGLNHVGTILRIYYGDECGIRAEKLMKDDKVTGTKMTIKLPVSRTVVKQTKEQDNDPCIGS
jgi:two-component system sensor histidine kinase YesM